MAVMKLKKLEQYLQTLDQFENPKIALEQYVTPPHIASCVLYNIQTQFEDITNKMIGDLGCGCGMLSIGAALLGAQLVIGFELDEAAIDIFSGNVSDMELPGVDCVQANVLSLEERTSECDSGGWLNAFDTVVSNPPFGTKNNAGMDIAFVATGIKLATGAVYSLHKSSTRDFIRKKAKEWHVEGEVVAELRYNLDASYRFHKSKSRDIEVDFWRFDVTDKEI